MESEGVKEALHDVHAHEHEESEGEECKEQQEEHNSLQDNILAFCFKNLLSKSLVEEDLSKLGVSKGKSPKTEIRGSVGNGTENEFNSFNQLVNEQLREGVVAALSTFFGKSFSNLVNLLISVN